MPKQNYFDVEGTFHNVACSYHKTLEIESIFEDFVFLQMF